MQFDGYNIDWRKDALIRSDTECRFGYLIAGLIDTPARGIVALSWLERTEFVTFD